LVDYIDSESHESTDADQPETLVAQGDTETPETKSAGDFAENAVSAALEIDLHSVSLAAEVADLVISETSSGAGDSGELAAKPTRRIRLVKKKSMQCESV
jgi:hypothetical protein